jgi:hypothetical protein
MRKYLLIFSFLVFAPSLSSARGIELVFGPEFTVSNQEMLDQQKKSDEHLFVSELRNMDYGNPAIIEYKKALMNALLAEFVPKKTTNREAARSGFIHVVQKFGDEKRSMFWRDNFLQFFVGVDPAVIELTTSPMTLEKFKENRDILQRALFDIPAEMGMNPQMFTGGGHINIGLSQFVGKPLLLRNFLVDLLNHNELFMGVFGYDTNNAASIWMLSGASIQSYRNLFERMNERVTINSSYLTEIVNAFVPVRTDPYIKLWRELPYTRGFAMAVIPRVESHQPERARLELRSVRPQQSMDMFLRQIELLQKRVNYLEKIKTPIPFRAAVPVNQEARKGDPKKFQFDPPIDAQKALASFYKYVTESGLRWEDHTDYIWPKWIADGELEKFNATLKADKCSILLLGEVPPQA